jgi:prefoldin beta subunit
MEEKEKENLIIQFQNYQQQLQNLVVQKESLKLRNIEIERALEELNSTKEKTAYKITGSVMVNKPVEELKKSLKEDKESLEARIKSLEKTEERVSSKLKKLQTKLKEASG